MKKKYVKPSIYVEDFTLMEHVAYGCTSQNIQKPDDTIVNTRDTSCSYDINGAFRLFTTGNTDRCDFAPDDFGDRGCYEGVLLNGGITFFLS